MVKLSTTDIMSFGNAETAFEKIKHMAQEEAETERILKLPKAAKEFLNIMNITPENQRNNMEEQTEEEDTEETTDFENFLEKLKRACDRGLQKEEINKTLKRKQYDRERYQQHREEFIQNAMRYKKQVKDDIPRMRQKLLKELKDGKKTWLATKTMQKYGITKDNTTKLYA